MSLGLNDLVVCVRKKETCLQGVASHAHHPLTEGEYQQQQTILCESTEHGNITHYGVPAFTNIQCHLIAHIDCVSQWQKVLFQPHDIYPEFAAKAQLSWSKTVNEECDAPWQIALGSKNPVHCVFISLVIWLELYLTTQQQDPSPYVFDFSGDFTIPGGGDKTNDFVANTLWDKV